MTFVLVGAGPTGVELAASIRSTGRRGHPAQELSQDRCCRQAARDHSTAGRRCSHSSRPLQESLSKARQNNMAGRRGFDWRQGREGRRTGGDRRPASGFPALPCFGQRARRAPRRWSRCWARTPMTSRARPRFVGAFMDIPDAPNVFVVGDAASTITQDGHPVPGVAQAAIQQGRFVGTRHRQPCQWTPQGRSAVSIPQQRQYGGGRQEFCDPRIRPCAQQWLSDLVGVGRATRARAAAASEPFPRSNAMVLQSYLSGQRSSRHRFPKGRESPAS